MKAQQTLKNETLPAHTDVEREEISGKRWDDPSYYKGVRIGHCKGCSKSKQVTRNGYCWTCEQAIGSGDALVIPGTGGMLAKAGSIL